MKLAVLLLIFVWCALTGAILAIGADIGVAVVLVLLLLTLTLVDYRIGVVALLFIAPLTSVSLIAKFFLVLLAVTTVVMLFNRMFGRSPLVLPPRYFVVLYLVPLVFALALGLPHLQEAYRATPDPISAEVYTTSGYIKNILVSRVAFVVLAVLLANAVIESKRPQLFLVPIALSASVIVALLLVSSALFGVSLNALQYDRGIKLLGAHANEVGLMLATAVGPLLFITYDSKGWVRWASAATLLLAFAGVALTFSRGAYLAVLATVAIFIIMRLRLRLLFGLVFACAVAFAFLPDSVRERATTGMSADVVRSAAQGSMTDPLTAGRIWIYRLLLPEVAKSPVWGRGAMSTAWTDAYKSGVFRAAHPHNLYLEILLDIGIAGLAVMVVFAAKTLRRWRALAADERVPPTLRSYFAGAAAAFLGMLAMGVANGHWLPLVEQSFIWMSLGMMFGMSARAARASPEASASPASPARPHLRPRPVVGWTARHTR